MKSRLQKFVVAYVREFLSPLCSGEQLQKQQVWALKRSQGLLESELARCGEEPSPKQLAQIEEKLAASLHKALLDRVLGLLAREQGWDMDGILEHGQRYFRCTGEIPMELVRVVWGYLSLKEDLRHFDLADRHDAQDFLGQLESSGRLAKLLRKLFEQTGKASGWSGLRALVRTAQSNHQKDQYRRQKVEERRRGGPMASLSSPEALHSLEASHLREKGGAWADREAEEALEQPDDLGGHCRFDPMRSRDGLQQELPTFEDFHRQICEAIGCDDPSIDVDAMTSSLYSQSAHRYWLGHFAHTILEALLQRADIQKLSARQKGQNGERKKVFSRLISSLLKDPDFLELWQKLEWMEPARMRSQLMKHIRTLWAALSQELLEQHLEAPHQTLAAWTQSSVHALETQRAL